MDLLTIDPQTPPRRVSLSREIDRLESYLALVPDSLVDERVRAEADLAGLLNELHELEVEAL